MHFQHCSILLGLGQPPSHMWARVSMSNSKFGSKSNAIFGWFAVHIFRTFINILIVWNILLDSQKFGHVFFCSVEYDSFWLLTWPKAKNFDVSHKTKNIYLDNYFNFHVCLSLCPLLRHCFQKLTSIPLGVSQNFSNKSCLKCFDSEKCAFWVTMDYSG